jgi:hypothetical protein
MDNGLIVPYPLACANAESLDTNTVTLCGFPFSEGAAWGCGGPDGVVGE